MDVIFLVILFSLLKNAEFFDYCTITCGKVKHTICEFGCPAPTPPCVVSKQTQSPEFRQQMVDLHNKYRSQVALGQLPDFESASNMNAVSYEMELEYVAFCWVSIIGKMKHDKCRNTKTFPAVGQNAWRGDGYPYNFSVTDWVDEYKLFKGDKDMINNIVNSFAFPSTDIGDIGHLTQVIWAKTTHIGCGAVKCGRDKIVICNYGPSGNYPKLPIYKVGPAGSKCGGKPVKDGLCGDIVKPPGFDNIGVVPKKSKVGFLHNNSTFKFILLLLNYLISLYLI